MAFASAAELLLAVVVYAWVGRRPTAAKVTALVVAFWAVELGAFLAAASARGLGPYAYCLQQLNASLGLLGSQAGSAQAAALQNAAGTVAGCFPALYAISASAAVFGILCLRWAVDRIRRRLRWSAFSRVDLSFWWVVPLIVGIAAYAVSMVPGLPSRDVVFLVAVNIVMVSAIPFFVQGAAAGKGIVNRLGIGFAWQLVLGFFAVVSGLAFVVLPLLGLVDIWANFRRLPRDGQDPAQRRLPD